MRKIFILFMMCAMGASLWALPTAVKNRAFFEGITYSWPYNADPSAQQQSNLGEIATDPDQIIAMLREVYSNPTIPGNYARGYSAEGVDEGTWQNGTATGTYPVAYPAIGTIEENNGVYGFSDAYGWGLNGAFYGTSKTSRTVTFDASVEDDCTTASSITKDGFTIAMSDLKYRSSTPRYYTASAGSNLKITNLNGYEITKVEITCSNSAYVSYFSGSDPAGTFKTNGAVRTWTGAAINLTIKNPNYRVQVSKVVITYSIPGTKTRYEAGSTKAISGYTTSSVSFLSSNSSDHSQGSSNSMNYNTKNHITIQAYNLNRSSGYSIDTKGLIVTSESGYQLTGIKLTFDGTASLNRISTVIYTTPSGNEVELNNSTTPSVASFRNATDYTFNFNEFLATSVTIKPSTSYSYITKVEVSYRYVGSSFNGYLDRSEYLPEEEGNTVLLVEVNDNLENDGVWANTLENLGLATFVDKTTSGVTHHNFDNYNITDYASLRAVVAATIKSVRVLTDAKRVGTGINAGTLFKIDADKLNRFYLLGKGQLRWFDNDGLSTNVNSDPTRLWSMYNEYQPYYTNFNFYDQSTEALFSHMFEQFSPSMATGGTALNDVYRLLVNGDSFDVVHDCLDVISAETVGHEFNMYGKESLSEDCQDVRDMMFFVPDYRMLGHEGNANVSKRDPNNVQKYLYYNPDHAPTLGLYVIKQNAITGSKQADADVYDLNLSWASNLLTFLPGEDAVYELLRVTTNADGTKTYTPVGTLDANTTTYIDHVPMQTSSQVVTYAVRGQDSSHFLSLQLSNEESFVVPGTDVSETMNLVLNADHWSRFDPQEEKNNYSNTISMGNNQVTNITSANLQSEHLFTFTRSYTDATGDHTDVIATATANASTKKMTVTMQNQGFFTYGYQTNNNNASAENADGQSFTLPITITTTGVNFGSFKLYDNFSVSVADNQHPNQYTYQVLFQFDGNDKYAKSNTMSVYVHKTAMAMEPEGGRAVSRDDIDGDVTRSLPANGTVDFDIDVKYSSKKEILRYDAYRWPEGATRYIIDPSSPANAEQDVPPTGIAGNQGDRYTVAMNADNFLYTGETSALGDEQTATQAHFVDNYVSTAAGIYTYAPVIEVFPPSESRSDYNTYGAPLQQAATGTITASERTSYEQNGNNQNTFPQKSLYTWDDNGTLCAYYTFLLNLDADIPEGYDLYKVRAWRQMDTDYQHEELSDRRFRMGEDVLFAEYSYPFYTKSDNATWPIGAGEPMQPVSSQGGKVVGEMAGTFGAIDVTTANGGQGIDIPITFVVRAYYTREANMTDLRPENAGGAPRRLGATSEADGKYYVLEKVVETTLKGTGENPIVTALTDAVADVRTVADVTYFNVTGMASKRPFAGVNVVVTRYTDGTTSSRRMLSR